MHVDFLIITALKDELDALMALRSGWITRWDRFGLAYHHLQLPNREGQSVSVVAAWCGDMGEGAAATRAAALVAELQPTALGMCGICAGKRGDTSLGDVIVADRVYSYDHGKLIARTSSGGEREEDFFYDITTYNLPLAWKMTAASLAADFVKQREVPDGRPLAIEWQRTWLLRALDARDSANGPNPYDLPERSAACPDWTRAVASLEKAKLATIIGGTLTPTVKGKELAQAHRTRDPEWVPTNRAFKVHSESSAIATGKTVREDPELFDRLASVVRKTLGVEMEAAAVGHVARSANIPAIIVKAVSDHGDGDKDDSYREFACRISAQFLLEFVEAHLGPGGGSVQSRTGARETANEAKVTSGLPADISRIVKYAPADLIGRDEEKKLLAEAWSKALTDEASRPHVVTIVGMGGEGKTSLVAKWAVDEMLAKGWRSCEAAFAWSFYSQGTTEQVAASSDLFLKEALTFFGDDADREFAASPASAFEKGQRLALVVGRKRSLLVLDGLEPLQHAATSPTPGQLRDQGVIRLLKGLATSSRGLCVVTTRQSLPDLRVFWQTTAPEVNLLRLSREAGVHLLQSAGVKGSLLRNLPSAGSEDRVNEFERLVDDVHGHALTLNLLGTYLRDAHAGDIRKRDRVKLEDADGEEQGGHAFRVMEAYEREFEGDGEKGQRALAVLRLLGLFDRPATGECLHALLQAPAISGLTEPLIGLTKEQRSLTFNRLEAARLLTVNRDTVGEMDSIDAHPLLRGYFAHQLRAHRRDGWRAAHRRIFEHLCTTAPKSTVVTPSNGLMRLLGIITKPTLEDLQPLYQAVAHACSAEWHEKAWTEVFLPRILRVSEFYSYQKLGAVGSDLAALACFFDSKWTTVSHFASEETRARVLNSTGLRLRMLGRLSEALEAQKEAVKIVSQVDPITSTRNLSELELELGEVQRAVATSAQCLKDAKAGTNYEQEIAMGATHGHALHQAGRRRDAMGHFRAAERTLRKRRESIPLLASVQGFHYCELILAADEQAAWRRILEGRTSSRRARNDPAKSESSKACRVVAMRAARTLEFAKKHMGPLEMALDHLTLARVALYRALSDHASPSGGLGIAYGEVEAAVNDLYRAGTTHEIPRALLVRACVRALDPAAGRGLAQADLDEAWEIAARGPMRLDMADIHLHRARFFLREAPYPWGSPQADLAAAEQLINDCGYHRRDAEVADLRTALQI